MRLLIITIVYLTLSVSCIVVIGCDNSPTNPSEEDQALSLNFPKGGETLSIGDTVSISFKANSDSVSSVKIQVSSNNGLNFFHISDQPLQITGNGINKYTRQWVIGREYEYDLMLLYEDTVFAGDEDPAWKCNIRIYAPGNEQINIKSESFTVNFKKPYYLRYPIGGESFNFSDTIPVIYTFRTDSMSAIQCFFWSIEGETWAQFLTGKETIKKRDYTCETYTRLFIPADPDLFEPVGDSTMIQINDYSLEIPKPLKSGWITLKK